ncbi:MAG: hypothetical protein KGI75_20025 [Rhizobiaceae bacterium]|nr:hypothetical protein [Rhizobiaceae bacterium]
MWKRLALILGAASISSLVHAAEISRTTDSSSDFIIVSGVLNPGDEATFRKIAATSETAIVVLNSEGGSLETGLDIGKAIRLRGFATAVLPDNLCASACALTWLAGSPRFFSEKSRVGFHASYRLVDGKASESGVGNALVGAYLNQLGLSEQAVVYVTSAPPQGMEWLNGQKALQVGIGFQPINFPETSSSAPPVSNEPYEPLRVVTMFYSALSEADGEKASALVVPEKRGKGPFNEQAIRSFFGAMSSPLRLDSTKLESQNLVGVTYNYVTSAMRVCRGRAQITTTYEYGKTLIAQIKALDGC